MKTKTELLTFGLPRFARNDKTRFTKTVSMSTCVAPRNDKGEKSSLARLCRAKQLNIVLREVDLGGYQQNKNVEIETHPRPLPKHGGEKRFAFTLAEVLITLAIIGVVATMTIPTLVADYQKKSWETSRDVFNRKLTEALRVMNVQQTIANKGDTANFVNELSKHFKITKICSNDKLQDCFNSEVVWGDETVDMSKVTEAKHFGLEWDSDLIGVQFANGVTGLVAYNPDCTGDPYNNRFTGTGCTSILYDTSGFKSPNTNGKDINNFGTINSLGGATCAFEIGNTCYGAPFIPKPHKWNACTSDGTSSDAEDLAFMKDNDITYCLSSDRGSDDYWAGAVEACKGVGNMPSVTELSNLMAYIYPDISSFETDNWLFCPDSSSCRKDDRLTTLGFAVTEGANPHIYSGTEIDMRFSYVWAMAPSFLAGSNGNRETAEYQAVCIIK